MKTKVTFRNKNGVKEREIDYIPIRFILAILLIILETVAVIGITILRWTRTSLPSQSNTDDAYEYAESGTGLCVYDESISHYRQ